MHTHLKRSILALLTPVLLIAGAMPAYALDSTKFPTLAPSPSPLRIEAGQTGVVTVNFKNNDSLSEAQDAVSGDSDGDFPLSVSWKLTNFRMKNADGVMANVTCAQAGISFVTSASATALPPSCVLEPTPAVTSSLPEQVYVLFTKPDTTAVLSFTVGINSGQTSRPQDGPRVETAILEATSLSGPTPPSISGMKPDPTITTFGHITIRSRDLLGYALRMKQDLTSDKSDNPIYVMYARSRQVANVMFVIALMIIAFFYNFAILISRDRLKRLLILFTIAIIGVNFSYTVASIAIQGSDRLFNVLLVRDDDSASGAGTNLNGNGKVIVAGNQVTEEDLLTMKNFTYSGFVGAVRFDPVDTGKPAAELNTLANNRYRENIYFNLALMTAGAIGQFAIVLVLLARIMILWALIIVAPFFFLLAIFKFSEEIFKYWSWFFFRWLLVGPLLAMFLSANVRIWTSTNGIPISSTYERANVNTFFANVLNIWVGAPGVRGAEGLNLETPDQVIRYLMGLMMLFLAVVLPFWLTRRILVFSPDKPSLLSKLLSSSRAKLKPEVKTPETPSPSKPPLKQGFAFNEASATAVASVAAAVGAKIVTGAASATTGTTTSAARAAIRDARDTSVAGTLGVASRSAATAKMSEEAEALQRNAARRLTDSTVSFAKLAQQQKPRAVPRNTDANVQALLRTASKSQVSSAELARLTNAELGELRTNLSSLASSSILGTNSALSQNLRTIERESQSRAENARSDRAITVKVQTLADRATKTRLDASDLAMLRMSEMQALKNEIESRVQANPALRTNEALHGTYDLIVAQIATQSLSSIATIAPAITAQTAAIVAALGRAEGVRATQLNALSVPELKEVSLAIHRMERAVHNLASLGLAKNNLATLQSLIHQGAVGAGTGAFDSQKVAALVQKVLGERISQNDLASLSNAEASAVVSAIERASNQASSTMMQVAHENLAVIQAASASRASGELNSAAVDAVLAKATAAAITAADLNGLSGKDLDAVSAELAAIESLGSKLDTLVAVDSSQPEYKESVVNVHAELTARKERGEDDTDDRTPGNATLVNSMLHRILAGQVVAQSELVILRTADLRALNRFVAVIGESGGGPGDPISPDSLTVALAAIEHEQEQRVKLEKRLEGETRVQLSTVYKKILANAAVGPSDLVALSDADLLWLKSRVGEFLDKARGEDSIMSAVDSIQSELKARRLKELALKALAQSPKVAEIFNALVAGATVKGAAIAGMQLEDLRLLTEIAERAASLVPKKIGASAAYTSSLRRIEAAFQKKSLTLLVQKVLDASPAAQSVLEKLRAAETLSAVELENLTLPELEAVQAESYRLNLQAPADVKANATYQDNLALVTQVYDTRVVERSAGTGSDGDGRFRFITGLQEAVGATLAQKIAELKAANKDDEAIELAAQQDDLGSLVDRSVELASERAEWIEYFKITPVPKVEGIRTRAEWIEAERALTHAIYDEIASQDWILQAKGIAEAASNLLMNDTDTMSPVQILTALAVKEAAAHEASSLVHDDDELVYVPAAKAAAAQATMPLHTFEDDDTTDARNARISSESRT